MNECDLFFYSALMLVNCDGDMWCGSTLNHSQGDIVYWWTELAVLQTFNHWVAAKHDMFTPSRHQVTPQSFRFTKYIFLVSLL